ncbi:DUF1330 domain-containing protein [Chitinophaga sp. Mgbs1]|uniref:DUF1330 domain-containing protein n=1 Tax=Chitinophaga solisilvae TaxID=1233460 RepID=A0A3S1CUL9_9BACT|nr:DUF1330 domain-containing protein [Chitinophaga solisilvae]
MAAYYTASYDILNEEEYAKYGPPAMELMLKYGAEVLSIDFQAITIEGNGRHMNAIVRFPSVELALQCYNDPAYLPLKELRLGCTKGCTMMLLHG